MSDPFGLNESRSDITPIPENRWVGRISSIEMERGRTEDGTRRGYPYLIYRIQGKDGKSFATFSRTFGETAHQALVKPYDVQIDFKPASPVPIITAIARVEPEEQQEGETDVSGT